MESESTYDFGILRVLKSAGNSFGCTVMIPLGRYVQEERAYAPQHLFTAIQHFQNSVEELFPGLYTWLAPASYHVTLRAIH